MCAFTQMYILFKKVYSFPLRKSKNLFEGTEEGGCRGGEMENFKHFH